MSTVSNVAAWVICVLVGLIGAVILWKLANGTINLSRLISEPNGDASMSRFQLLIFTFVVALSLFLVIIGAPNSPKFPDIPGSVLSLLGISASSYLVSKGIQFSNPAGVQEREARVRISPVNPTVRSGQSQQFSAGTAGLPSDQVTWSVVAGPGSIGPNGLYQAPAAGAGEAPPLYATVKAQSVDDPTKFDLAVVMLV